MSDETPSATAAEQKKYDWLRTEAGDCIDALDAALNSFSLRNLDSLIALRRQVRIVLDKARSLDLAALVSAAEHALDSGALDIRMSVETLLMLMRKAAHVGRSRAEQPLERDNETGLLNAGAFLRRLAKIESEQSSHVAVAAIHVLDAETLSKTHGDSVTPLVLNHVATILSDQLRDGDLIARMDDLEFAILLPMEDNDGLQAALSRIEAFVQRTPIKFPDGTSGLIRISCSGFQLGQNAPDVATERQDFNSQTIVGTLSGEPARPAGGAKCTIGIIVQNESTATVITSMLERTGYRTVTAGASGSDDRFASLASRKLHLAIIDEPQKNLPPLRKVLSRRRTPVIVLADGDEAVRWALENGARECLQKPVRTEDLLRSIKRHVLRGRAGDTIVQLTPRKGVLIVSEDVSQLIALGSALQKQGGIHIGLGRGADDAIEQLRRHEPAAVIIDIPPLREDTRKLLDVLATMQPVPVVILLLNASEKHLLERMKTMSVSGVLFRPLILRTLHTEVQRIAGQVASSTPETAHEIMRAELLRVMRTAVVPPPA